ncbi:MAG: hypothetical protein ACAH80_12315 [Alphaproteobacteria bacterium]
MPAPLDMDVLLAAAETGLAAQNAPTRENFTRHAQALSSLTLPEEWNRVTDEAIDRLQRTPQGQAAIADLKKCWDAPAGQQGGMHPDFERSAQAYTGALTASMNEVLAQQGAAITLSPPDVKFYGGSKFHDDGDTMPGRGGYERSLGLVYQRKDDGNLKQPPYAITWLTHETMHHIQYQTVDALTEGRLKDAPAFLTEAAAIFNWRNAGGHDVGTPPPSPPEAEEARRATYLLLPTEADAMRAGDKSLDLLGRAFPPEMYTSFKNNPEIKTFVDGILQGDSQDKPAVISRQAAAANNANP